MKRLALASMLICAMSITACGPARSGAADILLLGGRVLDGQGNPWVGRDIAVVDDRIAFVGNARVAGVTARDTLNVRGLLVTPGLWDMHSHADLASAHGREALPQLYQGITAVVLGVDGGGTNSVAEIFASYRENGIAVNALRYVGHGAARRAVVGMDDRPPTPDELDAMRAYVATGMEQGALGLSTGLFYVPGYYAETEEVIELAKVAAQRGGLYDTHDRDLGAAYRGIGYLASIREAIRIGEEAGLPVIFSHFNAQGRRNYGRAPEGARLVDEARERGVEVMAAQHIYTATQSSLSAYAIPRWAAAGGPEAMLARFRDPDTRDRLDVETMEMLAIRGGPEKILFTDLREELNGRTLADVARSWGLPVAETVRRILADGNAGVMNLDLYDIENTRYLARQEWMMTCTDGGTPIFGAGITHPRSYGAFTRKLRRFVFDEQIISLPFAVRGMTSLATGFLGIPDRGVIREGAYADLAVFDEDRIRDRATFQDPHRYSEGTVHVLVNGRIAFRDGAPTGVLAGRPIRHGGRVGTSRT